MARVCGRHYSQDVVMAIPTPMETETWKPIGHGELITSLEIAVKGMGLQINDRSYALAKDGNQMFGCWDVGKYNSNMASMIGLRNSLDKSLAIGIAAGTKVFVCDNLSFSGELVTFRRHTKNITVELSELCQDAVRSVLQKIDTFAKWHESLKRYALKKKDAAILTMEAMKRDVVNQTQFKDFYGLYFDSGATYQEETLYSWHEAVTEVNREKSHFAAFDRNMGLTSICNQFIEGNSGLLTFGTNHQHNMMISQAITEPSEPDFDFDNDFDLDTII